VSRTRRLIGSSCGTSSPWNQSWVGTYSYDQYDNLTKAGNITFNPGYSSSPSNNHELGSATYDANGNMTKNTGGTAVFGWNEFSKLKWTAGSGTPTCGTNGRCATYDAFGRMVEFSYLGTWTELWQVQIPGATISMNGTTANFGVWPAPGGLGAAVESGNPSFLHRDWLGSMRIASTTTHTVALDQAYAPYGEIYNVFGTSNTTRTEFAGQTADFDFGALFDTPNREFAQSDQGRWLSPDPAGSGWNQYAYVTNPNGQTDPLGLAPPTCNGDGAPCPVWGAQNGFCGNGGGFVVPCGEGNCNSLDGMPVPCGSGLLGSSESGAICPPGVNSCVYMNGPNGGILKWGNCAYDDGGIYCDNAVAVDNFGCTNYVMADCGAANNGTPNPTFFFPPKTCSGTARVLGGNPATVGQQGGVPGTLVQAGSAAAIPRQFGFRTGSGFSGAPISGTVGYTGPLAFPGTSQSFSGITDTIGSSTVPNVQNFLMKNNPGSLILELVTGSDMGTVPVQIQVPASMSCPAGTS
jgi:RHS repeat-associated protein